MTSQGRSENSDQSGPLHPMLPNADPLRNELPTSPATGGLRRLVSSRINFAYMYAALKCFKAKRKQDGGRYAATTERAAKC